MSLFPIPKGVINKINQIQRQFLWCGSLDKKAMPLIAWEIVELPKNMGGLSIGNILHRNMALLFKWVWNYFNNPPSLWRQVIQEKYRYPQSLTIGELQLPKTGGPWRGICASLLQHPQAKQLALNGIRKRVGDGSNTLFWHETWLEALPLKVRFPRLFRLALNQDATVASHAYWDGLYWAWSFSWTRQLRPRDIEAKKELNLLLQQAHLSLSNSDSLAWTHDKSGTFSTKSFTKELAKADPHPQGDAIKGIWCGFVPHRVEIFVWTALLGRIHTKNRLARLGIIPNSEDLCVLCNSDIESHDHLLLHCSFSSQLWASWLDLWNIKWVHPSRIRAAFEHWNPPNKNVFFKKVWTASFFIIIWTIWKERNSRIFKNTSSPISELHNLVLLRLGWWISGWNEPFPYSPTDIQRNPICLLWGGNKPSLQSQYITATHQIWTAPDREQLKWNVDASVNPITSKSAIGGVLRNHQGNFICLFSSPIPPMEINCAEVLAIHRAVTITLASTQLQHSSFVLESDSANAVTWCNSDTGGPWNLNFHLNCIRNMRLHDPPFTIVHKGRSSNMVVDSLAKQGLHRSSEFIAWT